MRGTTQNQHGLSNLMLLVLPRFTQGIREYKAWHQFVRTTGNNTQHPRKKKKKNAEHAQHKTQHSHDHSSTTHFNQPNNQPTKSQPPQPPTTTTTSSTHRSHNHHHATTTGRRHPLSPRGMVAQRVSPQPRGTDPHYVRAPPPLLLCRNLQPATPEGPLKDPGRTPGRGPPGVLRGSSKGPGSFRRGEGSGCKVAVGMGPSGCVHQQQQCQHQQQHTAHSTQHGTQRNTTQRNATPRSRAQLTRARDSTAQQQRQHSSAASRKLDSVENNNGTFLPPPFVITQKSARPL